MLSILQTLVMAVTFTATVLRLSPPVHLSFGVREVAWKRRRARNNGCAPSFSAATIYSVLLGGVFLASPSQRNPEVTSASWEGKSLTPIRQPTGTREHPATIDMLTMVCVTIKSSLH